MNEIAPIALSMIICDRVILDAIARRFSIRDIIYTISSPDYPALHPRLTIFFELTNGHGEVSISIKLVEVADDAAGEDRVLQETEEKIEFSDVREILTGQLDFRNITFPHPGEYRFQLFGADTLLLERRIVCRQVKGGDN